MNFNKNEVFVPTDVLEEAQEATNKLMPTISKPKYEKTFQEFSDWRDTRSVKGTNEDVLLAYFLFLQGKGYKASSLWAKYSMLKCTLNIFENTDISR